MNKQLEYLEIPGRHLEAPDADATPDDLRQQIAALLAELGRSIDRETFLIETLTEKLEDEPKPAPRRKYRLPSLNLWRIRDSWDRRCLLVVTVIPMMAFHILYSAARTAFGAFGLACAAVVALLLFIPLNTLIIVCEAPGMFVRCWRRDLPPWADR